VRELRLHRSIYRRDAVDEAAEVYRPHAMLEIVEEPDYWTLRIAGISPERERRVAGELANYALGSTVRGQGQRSPEITTPAGSAAQQ
jgi:hypothetical protein